MTADFQAYDAYIEQHFDAFIEELRAFCAEPSLAGQGIGLAEGEALVRRKITELEHAVEGAPHLLWRTTGPDARFKMDIGLVVLAVGHVVVGARPEPLA